MIIIKDDNDYMHPDLTDDIGASPRKAPNTAEFESDYWRNVAQDHLKQLLEEDKSTDPDAKAKNIILFLGDGMSLATVAATRMYMGAEEGSLSFEKFPHFGLSKVCL